MIPALWQWSLVAARLAGLAASTVAAQDTSPGQAIRRVDFRNFAYEDTCIGEVRVTAGEGWVDLGPLRGWFYVKEVVYGDPTGDGWEEAVVLTLCGGGGSMTLSEGSIYTLREGRSLLLAYVKGGDRAHGGISRVRIVSGLLEVTRYDGNGGMCCPQFTVTTTYRLDAGRLVEVGAPLRMPIGR